MRRRLPAFATVVGVAVLVRVVYAPSYLNYDARYALLWARDVTRGLTPDYEAPFAPTPHPLSTAWSAIPLPFGEGGDMLVIWFTLLAFGLLVYLAYELGAELFAPSVGVITALVVATRPAFARDVVLAYQDLPFACLVVGAVLLEARQPRRGGAVLGLLVVAGLLRPEAWALAGLYWLYLFPARDWPQRIALAGAVIAAPLIWALMDLAVTGDALHSLHGTSALAETNERRREVGQVPYWTAQYFGFTLREPVLIGIPVGLAFCWVYRERFARAAALPLSVALAMTAVFALNPFFGLPLIGRYVRTPSVFLAIFYGVAIAGWVLLRPGRERAKWRAGGVVVALLSVIYLPWHISQLSGLENRVDAHAAMFRDLRSIADEPAVERALEQCGPLAATDHRPVPHLRYWLDGDPGSVVTTEGGSAERGKLLIVPRRNRDTRAFYRSNFPRERPPAGWERVARNRSWLVVKDC